MTFINFDDNLDSALIRMRRLGRFQLLHNEIKKDFIELHKAAATSLENRENCPELIRSCVREFFSLVEADIYFLNYIDPYPGYTDSDSFLKKFKQTYKYHCLNHNRPELFRALTDKHFHDFKQLKRKRDCITHPKSFDDISVDKNLLDLVINMFNIYTEFVSNSMRDTGVSFKVKNISDFIESFKNIKE